MGRARTLGRFLLKEPKEVREEARLWERMEIGEGLESLERERRGDVVRVRVGEAGVGASGEARGEARGEAAS